MFDVFVSYRHSDGEAVRTLVAGLQRRGLNVWFDEASIQDFGGISEAARLGLAQSKALVVYYSEEYPLSAPCQWELTSAFSASERLGDPRQRVLVVNPESGPAHIEPVELRDALYRSVSSDDPSQMDQVADAISAHLAALDGELGAIRTVNARLQRPCFTRESYRRGQVVIPASSTCVSRSNCSSRHGDDSS